MPNSVADMPEPEPSAPGTAPEQVMHKVSDDGLPSSASLFTTGKESASCALNASDQSPGTCELQKKESTAEKKLQEHGIVKERSRVASIMLVLVCFTGMLVNISCITAASISLPRIGQDFDVEEDSLQWIVSAYSLSSGCFLLFFGRLADLHGRKKGYLLGTAWLGIFSLGCGFAQEINTLFVLRGLQGIGAAALVPAAIGILANAFPPGRTRSVAFAVFSSGAPVGGAVGLQIGGILIQWAPATWRAPFFLSAGLAVVVVLGGMVYIDKDVPSTEEDKRVDWLGVVLITMSLALITFVLGQGELAPQRWRTPYIIALLVIGVVLLALFLLWEWYLESDTEGRRPAPLMKLSMWKRAHGRFAAMQTIAFFEWASFQSWIFWAQLYYQDYAELSPILTAIRFLPMFVVGVTCNFIVALVVGHVPGVIIIVFGTALTSLAGLLFGIIQPASPYWSYGFPAAIVSVVGADFVFACGTIFVAKVALPHEQSLAGGLFQTLTQIGSALGLAATTILHNSILREDETKPEVDAQLKAYQTAQWLVFAFGIFGSLIALACLRDIGAIGDRKKKLEQNHDADAEIGAEPKPQPLDI